MSFTRKRGISWKSLIEILKIRKGLKCLNWPSASCSCETHPCAGGKIISRYTLLHLQIPSIKESPRWNHAISAGCDILTFKKYSVVCLLPKLINKGKQICQPHSWYFYLLINSVNQNHNAFCSLQSPALTAKDAAMDGKTMALKNKERFVVSFSAKAF